MLSLKTHEDQRWHADCFISYFLRNHFQIKVIILYPSYKLIIQNILQLFMLAVIFCVGQLGTQNIKEWKFGSTPWVKNPPKLKFCLKDIYIFFLGRGWKMSQMTTVVLKPVTETGTTEALHILFFLLCLYIALHFSNVFFFSPSH